MNCSPTIAIALLLLSLTAGMALLYKTQKENLGILFKIVAWFVIVVSIGAMVCCSIRCVFHCCRERRECGRMDQCGMNREGCDRDSYEGREGLSHHGYVKRRIIVLEGDNGECERMEGRCGKEKMECGEGEEEEMDCCKNARAHECEKGEEKKSDMHSGNYRKEMRKDTVIIRKK